MAGSVRYSPTAGSRNEVLLFPWIPKQRRIGVGSPTQPRSAASGALLGTIFGPEGVGLLSFQDSYIR